jgi:hypothetical protein
VQSFLNSHFSLGEDHGADLLSSPTALGAWLRARVGTAIGGFALAYRATLLRGASDQAANRVPLDALVAASPDFTRPLDVAPLARWRSQSGGNAFEVRRTDATYVAGAASSTVPALGVPAAALRAVHGWRAGDASVSPDQMSRAGATRPGPGTRPDAPVRGA